MTIKKILKKKKIRFLIFLIVLLIAVFYLMGIKTKEDNIFVNQHQLSLVITPEESTTTFPIADTRETPPFSFLDLSAKGVVVFDLVKNKILFSQDKDNILPIASITKLMTIYTASKFLAPDSIITITQEDLILDSNSNLTISERWDFKNLRAFTLISSSNAGANAIAREAQNISQTDFISEMNKSAEEIGLRNTYFRNPTGLDMNNDSVSGANSTPYEIVLLYSYLYRYHPDLLVDTNKSSLAVYSLDGKEYGVINTNNIINDIPDIISSKTGTTFLAGGNLAMIFNPVKNHPVAIVILGDTFQGRFTDMSKLVKDTTKFFR